MKLEPTSVQDLYVLKRPVFQDNRGQFTRLYAAEVLEQAGLPSQAVHVNSSTSVEAGTLRGIHFQYPPYSETKIVACTAGAIWDVGVDLRPGSLTRFQWFGQTLTPRNGVSMVIPEGFGHAFITLEPNSTAIYVVSEVYEPKYESGVHYGDPLLNIQWPVQPKFLSRKDLSWDYLETRISDIDRGFRAK